jgi:hypothetical protein
MLSRKKVRFFTLCQISYKMPDFSHLLGRGFSFIMREIDRLNFLKTLPRRAKAFQGQILGLGG